MFVLPNKTFEVSVGPTTSGLVGTIGVQITDGAGSTVMNRITTGIVEFPVGSGIYNCTLVAPNTPGQYLVIWNTGSTFFVPITLDVEGQATVVSPISINQTELNQLRRLIGDLGAATPTHGDVELVSLLNDTTLELTRNFSTPLSNFSSLYHQYHNEVIYKAAINWWWNRLGQLQERHSMSVGSAAVDVNDKWQRAWQMIQSLETRYDEIQQLNEDITIGNYSRYSKQTLRRIGGVREEDTNA